MIIREYEYQVNRPWNCQERFIVMENYDDPWLEYKYKLFGVSSSDISMIDRIIEDTMREGRYGLSFEFEICGARYVHVAQDWTNHYKKEPIIKTIRRKEDE